MSSSHIVIVARNEVTGEVKLATENNTLYGTGDEESILQLYQYQYSEEWVLSLYAPMKPYFVTGTKPAAKDR